jgi:hypothetical protein
MGDERCLLATGGGCGCTGGRKDIFSVAWLARFGCRWIQSWLLSVALCTVLNLYLVAWYEWRLIRISKLDG